MPYFFYFMYTAESYMPFAVVYNNTTKSLKKPYEKIAFVTHPDERDKVLSLIDIASDSYKKDILFASKDQIQNPAFTMIEIAKNMDFDDYAKGPKYVREHSGLCRE